MCGNRDRDGLIKCILTNDLLKIIFIHVKITVTTRFRIMN